MNKTEIKAKLSSFMSCLKTKVSNLTKKQKLIIAGAVAASIIVIAGCSWLVGYLNRPKIPANTVVAVYVDLDRSVDNLADVTKMVIKRLPDEMKDKAKGEFEEMIKTYKEEVRCFKFDWACITLGLDFGHASEPEIAAVIKCKYNAKGKSEKTLPEFAKLMLGGRDIECSGTTAAMRVRGEISGYLAFVSEKYVIWADNEDTLKKMVKLYNGEGECSKAFGDLTKIDGDTIARIKTCRVKDIAEIFSFKGTLEEFADKCGDDDLIDEIMDIGDIKLDIKISDDVIGCDFFCDAGSEELAKFVEGVASLGQFGTRIFCACQVGQNYLNSKFGRVPNLIPGIGEIEISPKFYKMLRKATEIDRDDTEVTIETELDTDDVLDYLVEPLIKKIH